MVPPLKAGQLRKRVRLQQIPPNVTNPDAYNAPDLINSWADVATIWASIEPLTGRELAWAEVALVGDVTHKVTIRYFSGVNAKMRFAYLDPHTNKLRYFNIEFVRNPEERNRRLECICHESA